MDQLIPVIEFLKKNKFWLTCGFLAVAIIGTWFYSSGKISKETNSDKQAITQKIAAADKIRKVTPEGADEANVHPNQFTNTGMESEISDSIDSIVEAWKIRYDRQSEVRTWPAEVIKSPNFVELFSSFDPPETFPTDQNGSLMLSLLYNYRQQIPAQMANIAAMANTKWKFAKGDSKDPASGNNQGRPSLGDGRGGSGITAEGAETDTEKPVVRWNDANQELWQEKLTSFKGRDDHRLDTLDPSPLQVYMLQQDLWLLEAMFQIIGKVNEGAIATDLAPIKQIDHIAFGREARGVLGSVQEPNTVIGGSAGTESSESDKISDRRNSNRGGSGNNAFAPQSGGVSFDVNADDSPFHGRYVDQNFEPIAAPDVRKVIYRGATDLPDQYLELIVARRVPVRLGVVMDETKISEFIAQCAKSPFTFEIHQIRINKHIPGDGIELKGGQSTAGKKDNQGNRGDNLKMGGGGGGSAGMEGAGGSSGGNAGSGGKGELSIGNVDNRRNFDVKVEFFGIVKIYNKVDEARLRGKKAAPPTKP